MLLTNQTKSKINYNQSKYRELNLKKYIKLHKIDNKIFDLNEEDYEIDMQANWSSSYVPSLNWFIRGETNNKRCPYRKNILTVTDLKTGKTISKIPIKKSNF